MVSQTLLKISDTDSSMLFDYFKGDKYPSITLKVFVQGQKGTMVKITINKYIEALVTMMEINLNELLMSQEPKSLLSVISPYEKDPATGKAGFKLAAVISLSKNNEGVYSVGLKTNSYSHEYILTSPSGLSNNSAQMSMKDRSQLGAQTLLRELRNVIPRLKRIEEIPTEPAATPEKKFGDKPSYQASQQQTYYQQPAQSTTSNEALNGFTFN